MFDSEQRGFQGIWIPATLWTDKSLSRLEMEIIADISSFDTYYKSNEAMAEFFGVSVRHMQRTLADMEKKNLIERDVQNADKGNCIGRIIRITKEQHERMYPRGVTKMSWGGDKNVRGVVTKMSPKNTYENTYENTETGRDYLYIDANASKCKKFHPPTVAEIRAYIMEQGYRVDADTFFDYYESKGWVVGKSPMKDWIAAVRNWNRNQKQKAPHEETAAERMQRFVDAMQGKGMCNENRNRGTAESNIDDIDIFQ